MQHYDREPNANGNHHMDQINQDYPNSMETSGYIGDFQGNSFGNMEPKEQKEGLMDRSYGHHTHVYHDHMHNHTNEHDHEHKVTSSSLSS